MVFNIPIEGNMMRKLFLAALAVFCLAAMCHAEVQSGGNGSSFAANVSLAQCGQSDVSAVYICSGNVVEAVSSVPGAGSTFYRPDGMVIDCPAVAISNRSAECVQFANPNICGNVSVCTGQQAPATNVSQQPAPQPPQTQPTENGTLQPQANQSQVSQPQTTVPPANVTTIVTKRTIQGPDQSGIIVLGILVIGMFGLAALHYMYKKTGGQEPL